MILKIKKLYWRYKYIWEEHPIFRTSDKMKIHFITKDTFSNEIISLSPKTLKYPIKIRKNFTDKEVLFYVLQDQYHLPVLPIVIPKNAVILDLGSNIGLTMAHFKNLFPDARIIGCEMNKANYQIAAENIKFFKDVKIINTAVWIHNEGISYSVSASNDSFSIAKGDCANDQNVQVSSTTINRLITDYNLTSIDYMKMDIEGAETDILDQKNLEWLDIVKAIGIEFHSDEESLNKYKRIIEEKGYKVWRDNRHWNSILAIRINC